MTAVEAFLEQYIAAFNARDGARIAAMDWEMRREDASAIRRWRQSYHLVAGDGGLRVLASTIHLQ